MKVWMASFRLFTVSARGANAFEGIAGFAEERNEANGLPEGAPSGSWAAPLEEAKGRAPEGARTGVVTEVF